MKHFILEGGEHRDHETGTVYKKGDKVPSPHDLDQHFPGKFRRAGEDKVEVNVINEEELRGENLTPEFKKADQLGLQVFYRENRYVVVTNEDVTRPVEGSEKGFTSKRAVNEFLREQEEDDEDGGDDEE